jgi:hypothetical protein
MGTNPASEIPQPAPQPAPPALTFWQRHGTTAQIVSAACGSFVLGIAVLGVIWHYSADSGAKTDKHINDLITEQITPLGKIANDEHIGRVVGDQVRPLSEKLDKIAQDMAYLKGKAGIANTKLNQSKKPDPNLLVNSSNPNKALTNIRVSLEQAQKQKEILPDLTLAEYRKKVQTLPTSATDYWVTVAAVINYQSYVNQIENKAPDPLQVAKPCLLTKGSGGNYNLIQGANQFSRCIVDLDGTTNDVEGAVFRNSLIRWHGGPVTIKSATFINCRFVIDIKTEPARPDLLKQLLASDQTYFTLASAG